MQLFEDYESREILSIDDLMLEYFDCLDEIMDFVIDISTKGGLLNESQEGQINVAKVRKLNEEAKRIINRIREHIENGKLPHPGQTNELIDCLNFDDIPKVIRLMTKVFRNAPRNGVRVYDDDDKQNMHDVCIVYKNTVDSLRSLLDDLNGRYDLPKKFNLPYKQS